MQIIFLKNDSRGYFADWRSGSSNREKIQQFSVCCRKMTSGFFALSINTVNLSMTPIVTLNKESSFNMVRIYLTGSISRWSNSIFNDYVQGKTSGSFISKESNGHCA